MNVNATDAHIISSMGAGNKIDPTAFEVTDIYKTSVCPLAKVMHYELKRRDVKKLKVVYSKDPHYTDLRHGNQLPCTLYLSARNSAKIYSAPTGSGQQCFCFLCCRLELREKSSRISPNFNSSRAVILKNK